jgi:hypothetical protein
MQQFKISEEAYRKFRKKWYNVIIPLAAVPIVVVLILVNTGGAGNGEVNTLPFVIPFVLILIGFSYYRGLKKQKQFVMSYSVTISDTEITREQMNTPPLSINFMEIKEIIKTEKGGFTIKGLTRTDVIHISYLIENPEALQQRLETFAPIRVSGKDPFYKKYRILLSILALGSIVAVITLTNKVIVGICGTLVTGLLIWSFYEIRTSKNIPINIKRRSWIYLIFIASIIYITYSKLTGSLTAR